MGPRTRAWSVRALAFAGAASAALWACGARASESGASLYLLGSGGPEAAIMLPVPRIFLDSTGWFYQGAGGAGGGGGRAFSFGGNVIADVNASIPAYFATLLWQPASLPLRVKLPPGAHPRGGRARR